MNQKLTRTEAERMVDNAFERLRILAVSIGAPDRLLETIKYERGVSRAVIRSVRCGGCEEPRKTGTVEIDDGGES